MNALGSIVAAVALGSETREIVPGPGFELRGDRLYYTLPYWTPTNSYWTPKNPWVPPGSGSQLLPPGTPVEGSKLTTETKELVPCFAAVLPACPGHWRTNLTEWAYRSGRWAVEAPLAPSTLSSTNAVTTNFIDSVLINWGMAATNVFTPIVINGGIAPNARALRLEKEALEKQVEFWKAKALEGRP